MSAVQQATDGFVNAEERLRNVLNLELEPLLSARHRRAEACERAGRAQEAFELANWRGVPDEDLQRLYMRLAQAEAEADCADAAVVAAGWFSIRDIVDPLDCAQESVDALDHVRQTGQAPYTEALSRPQLLRDGWVVIRVVGERHFAMQAVPSYRAIVVAEVCNDAEVERARALTHLPVSKMSDSRAR